MIQGTGSAATQSTKGAPAAPKTASADTTGKSSNPAGTILGIAAASHFVKTLAKKVYKGIRNARVVIAFIGPIIPILLVLMIVIGTSYHKESTPSALGNEARIVVRDDTKDLSNSAAYTLMYARYSDCLSQIIHESYNDAVAKAKEMGRSGVYEEDISEPYFSDLAGDTLNINIAKLIAVYSVYAGEDAFLPDFRETAEAAKDALFTFTTEEVIEPEQLYAPDYTETELLVYDPPTEDRPEPSSHTETYYFVPGSEHPCVLGETIIRNFAKVSVQVAVLDESGVITGFTTEEYMLPASEPELCTEAVIDHKGLAVTINPLDEDIVFGLWPVDPDALAQGRNITNGELIALFEDRILTYLVSSGVATDVTQPTVAPIGDAAFDRLAAEINKFITAQNTHGVRYVYGADNPYTEMDCSSFIARIFWYSGVARSALFPSGEYSRHNCRTLYNACRNYGQAFSDPASLKPGDLIFLTGTQGENFPGQATHVLIYIGNMQTVEMAGAGISVRNLNDRLNSPDWNRYFYAYGRLPEH